MSDANLKAELEALRADNARLKASNEKLSNNKAGKMKVSEKGAMSLYGMGRFPVTLYKSQWNGLLEAADDIRAFLKANDSQLKSKAD